MKKLLTLAAIFALVFTTCEQPTEDNTPKLPSLTIRNESSYVLTNVTFSGISFATSGNDLPISSRSVKQLTANDVNKAGYITFIRKDIGIACRTEAVAIGNEDNTFTFLDTSVVEELANSGNKKSLAQITFVSKVTVERGGLTVAKNDTENLGEAVINIEKSTEFTLNNSSGGKLLFTGTEPVKITGTGAGAFSAVQPSSSEILPNNSLTFKINFTPAVVQNYSATVTIYSNDQDGDFTFNITATGVPPKPIASVFYDENEILQNGTINAGEVFISLSKNIVIVIRNTGAGALTLDTENITITGSDAGAFIKITNPGGSISAGSQSPFTIECTPTKQGESNATLTIPTNDSSRNQVVVFLRITAVIPTIVNYDINGGSGITPAAQMINAGSMITLHDGSGFSKSGYTFGGWNTNSSGTGTNYDADSSYIPTGSLTLYAKWNAVPTYTVTYNINGGTGTTPTVQTVYVGNSVTLADDSGFTKSGYTFAGWNNLSTGNGTNYNAGSSYTFNGNVTLYAKWQLISDVNVPGANLAAKLDWLQTNAIRNVKYTVEVTANESISPTTLSYSSSVQPISITLKGTGAVRTISLLSNGAMFTVGSNVTLVLDNNITLQGLSDNTSSLVVVNDAGILVMNTGSRIIGNTNTSTAASNGGGVYVGTLTGTSINYATFTMNGGEISGNSSRRGGGVYVYGGIFTKTGGTIYGYSASDTVNSNVVVNSSGTVVTNYPMGHAVYADYISSVRSRNTTAGPSVNLSINCRDGTYSGGWGE